MLSFLKEKIKSELKKIKFQGKPAAILIITIFILIVPKYRRYFLDKSFLENTLFLQVIFLIIIILFVFREKLSDNGLGLGFKRRGLIFLGVFFIGYLPFLWLLSNNTSFIEYYKPQIIHIKAWQTFLYYELNSFLNLFKTEFVFRGFLLFGLRKDLGDANAIFIQVIPYSLLHVGKPEIECYGSVMVGIALGYLAIKTNSVWYGLFLHWILSSLLVLVILFP